MFPLMRSRISSFESWVVVIVTSCVRDWHRRGAPRRAARRQTDLARRAVPALEAVVLDEGGLHRVQSISRGHPSIVVTCRPLTLAASVRHESTRRPSTRTVQAPHCPWSQPFFVPVSASRSRNASSKTTRASISSVFAVPLTFSVTLTRCCAAVSAANTAPGEGLSAASASSCASRSRANTPSPPAIVCPRNLRRDCPTSVKVGISFSNVSSSAVKSVADVSSSSSFMTYPSHLTTQRSCRERSAQLRTRVAVQNCKGC